MLTMKWLHLFWWPLWLSDNLPAASGRSLIGPTRLFLAAMEGHFIDLHGLRKRFPGNALFRRFGFQWELMPLAPPYHWDHPEEGGNILEHHRLLPQGLPWSTSSLPGPSRATQPGVSCLNQPGCGGGTVTANLLRFHDPSHGQRFWHHKTTALSPVSTSEVF